jgi:DNA (cytosine-5)-methyltransferase 1
MAMKFKEEKIIMEYERYSSNRDVISLFSGAMGLDIGLTQAGLTVKVGQDFDKACVETMQANGHNVVPGNIQEIEPQQLLDMAGLSVGEPFLICGGPPCQPFSTAGKRLGINDPRGSLFMDFIRMISYIKPRFFVMENVKGIMSAPLKHTPIADRTKDSMEYENQLGTVLDVVLNEFKKLGYTTVYGVLDAVNYGVPQFRERFVLIGSRDHEDIYLPMPSHFQMHQNKDLRWNTLYDAIHDLENDYGDCTSFSEERMQYLKLVPQGGNWRSLPEEIIKAAMGGAYESGGGKVGFYRRLDYKQPSPTLVTSPVQKASMLCHPTQNRPLSVKEYARIQQFPDNWVFKGTTVAKYRQIGNAVPVGLARALGQTLLSVANNDATIKTKRVRGTDVHNRIKNAIEMGYNYGDK